ncbi:transporter [[Clostridium] innocuum]|uniref:Transporter n=1 Tax=Clostridium innocuum TaxID=1522 RepID=A0A099I5E5_CLOIN|nr:polyphosphate polymerase domain-containing protein [[Clostridium] innocuum]KGJ53189.1 transporter [[Clostridium] innocuum]
MKQVIQRFEKKYLLDSNQCRSFVMRIQPYITEDIYPASTIYNLYLDTEQFDLIHRSIEKPPFKEKLRIRSYTPVCSEEEPIYLEIKRKYAQIVCKRRMQLSYGECRRFLNNPNLSASQIEKELSYTLYHYQVQPRIFLAYDRISYVGKQEQQLRITMDSHIRSRFDHLSLNDHESNEELFHRDMILLEIKAERSYPLWLSSVLSDMRLYPTSFSKVGQVFYKKEKGELLCLQAS